MVGVSVLVGGAVGVGVLDGVTVIVAVGVGVGLCVAVAVAVGVGAGLMPAQADSINMIPNQAKYV